MPDNMMGMGNGIPDLQGAMQELSSAKNMPIEKPVTKELNEGSDSFTPEEQKSIVKMVIQDIEADELVLSDWKESRKKALWHKNNVKPSIIEGIKKEAWQSDRNLGIGSSVADVYHSTLFSTVWNPESIHFKATEKNDVDNKDNLEKFTKVIIGREHCNVMPQIDDYIQNKVDLGFGALKVYREVKYDWIDRDVAVYEKGKLVRYETKTEKKRFERMVLENIANVDDILIPRWGKSTQELPHIIHVLHLYGSDIEQYGENKVFVNVDKTKLDMFKIGQEINKDNIETERASDLDLIDAVDDEFRALPIDVYEWYGYYTKNGRREKYRFHVERKTQTFLSGKPLRKISKSGRYPFVLGTLDKIPGQIVGKDIYCLIADPINALNETFNQKADFQYVTNCPFGFHKATEGYMKGEFKLMPGVSYPTDGNPSEEVFFPNIQRSMAWAESDIRILYETIEKRTGAATYFQTNERNVSGTATRDMLVSKQSETRFGKHVNRAQDEVCEAITMLVNGYQEHMPDDLGSRILGEDGKGMFENLSVETLRYNADCRLEPDVTGGSKAYERQVMLWAFGALQQSIWLDPRVNPKGNWQLTARVMKSQGIMAPEAYLPPEPKPEIGTGQDVENIWAKIKQGDVPEIQPSWDLQSVTVGLYKKKAESYYELDEEYRPVLDNLIFNCEIEYQKFLVNVIKEQMASRLAQQMIMRSESGFNGQNPEGTGIQPNPQQNVQPQPNMQGNQGVMNEPQMQNVDGMNV